MILMCVITSIYCIIVRYNAQAVVRAATLEKYSPPVAYDAVKRPEKSDKWRYTLRSKNRRKDEYCATSGGNA